MSIKDRLHAFTFGLNIAKTGIRGGTQGVQSSLQSLLTPKWQQPPARNTYQFLDMYSKNPRMNPVRKISEDVGGAKFKLYTDQKKEKVIDTHPLLDLLNKPNPMPEFTGYLTRYLTEVYLLLKGQGYWVLERNGFGMPTEIWLLPPHWIRETPSIYRPFYTVQPLGVSTLGVMYIPQEDVVYFKDPYPLDPYARGVGQAEGIADEIEIDEYMAKYAKRFFYNDAMPPFVVTAPGADETEIDRMEERWKQKHAGVNNSHDPAFLNWQANIQILKETNKEMEFIESRKALRDMANQHFNIPPEVLGIVENSNRATIDSAFYIYAKNVLSNKLRLIEDAINTQLCSMFKDNPYFEFDNVVPDDKEFELKKHNDGTDRGTVLLDEWRKANGFEPLPNGQGQVLMIRTGMNPVKPADLLNFSMSQLMDSNITQEGDNIIDDNGNDDKSLKKTLTKADRTLIAKAIQKNNKTRLKTRDKIAKPLIKDFNKALKSYFDGMKEEVIEKVKAGSKDPVDLEKWNKTLETKAKPLYQKTFKAAGQAVVNEFKSIANSINKDDANVTFDYKDPNVIKAINNKVIKIKGVNQTTKDNIAKIIQDAYNSEDDFTIDKLAQIIEEYTGFDEARANTIAQTETLTSLNQATILTYSQNSDLIDGKAWLSNADDLTRETHLQASMDYDETNSIPVDDYFNVGGYDCLCPGDDELPAEEVVNCRCCMMPVVKA